MKISSRILERSKNATMIAVFLVSTGLYSIVAQAQTITPVHLVSNDHPVTKASNAARRIKHHPSVQMDVKAEPLHASINGPYAELKPAVAPDGKRIYFSRADHPDNSYGESDYEDIWYAERDSANDTWSNPVRLPGHLNNSGPNFIHNVSASGDTIILGNEYLKKGKMRDGLSYSVNIDGQWSQPLPIRIDNHYNISEQSNAFVSLKLGIIIQAIQRTETVGERDLYVSFWNGTKATEPINMGSVINSMLEESSPYLAPDTRTLYFASKGHNGYGGLDIFVSKRLDDTWTNWSEPENLGPAVNGVLDEEHFNITHCGKKAIFSKQVSVHNFDLYAIQVEDLFEDSGDGSYESEEAVATFR